MGRFNHLFGWLKLGICRCDLVLEVGSGGPPFAWSDVLCDMLVEASIERSERAFRDSILIDRPFVCANAEMLPFWEGAFDFIRALLVCLVCQEGSEQQDAHRLTCIRCYRVYPIQPDGIPILMSETAI